MFDTTMTIIDSSVDGATEPNRMQIGDDEETNKKTDTEIDYLTSKFLDMKLGTDSYFTVTSVVEFRPDLISQKFYGTYNLGWLIALHNEFLDPTFDFTVGKKIKIPSITDYYKYYNRNSRRVVRNVR